MYQELPGRSDSPLSQLIRYLVNSFPVPMDLDYFGLCEVDLLCTVLPASARTTFDLLSGYIELLLAEGIIKADQFRDSSATFYWNVVLTAEGFRRTSRVLAASGSDGWSDDRRLLLDLCSDVT